MTPTQRASRQLFRVGLIALIAIVVMLVLNFTGHHGLARGVIGLACTVAGFMCWLTLNRISNPRAEDRVSDGTR